jgi:hypothetical protein
MRYEQGVHPRDFRVGLLGTSTSLHRIHRPQDRFARRRRHQRRLHPGAAQQPTPHPGSRAAPRTAAAPNFDVRLFDNANDDGVERERAAEAHERNYKNAKPGPAVKVPAAPTHAQAAPAS